MRGILESISGIAILLVMIVVGGLLFGLFVKGTVAVANFALPALTNITGWLFVVCVVVLIPLKFFRRTRAASIFSLHAASYVFGFTLWLYSFVVALQLWGVVGLLAGLFFAGVGVVPVAFLAALIGGHWFLLGQVCFGILLTYGSRILSLHWAERMDAEDRINLVQEVSAVSESESDITTGALAALSIRYCGKCGSQAPENAGFCGSCGASQLSG